MRVISSATSGTLVNHQQPKTCRLRNFRASTHSSCWFSRDSTVARNLFSGKPAHRFCSACGSLRPTPSPASRSCGLTARFTPSISANGRPNSRQCGNTAFSINCAQLFCSGNLKSGGSETIKYFAPMRFDQSAQIERGQNSAARFGNRRMLDEQRLPNQIRLLRFGKRPEFLKRQIKVAERLGHQIMIRQEVVDPPKQQPTECGIVEVRVNVGHRSCVDDLFDTLCERGTPAARGSDCRCHKTIARGLKIFRLQ